MSIINILIVGVGGQGTLLAGKVIGTAAMSCGYDVKISEVHGMAQRGGSVITHVRIGIDESVISPLVGEGCADIIIAFEELEALRWISYLKRSAKLIANLQKIEPMPVLTGDMKYPEDIPERLIGICSDAIFIDAFQIANECGSIKAVNMVLLGAASVFMDFDQAAWMNAVEESVPEKFKEVNVLAFTAGRKKCFTLRRQGTPA